VHNYLQNSITEFRLLLRCDRIFQNRPYLEEKIRYKRYSPSKTHLSITTLEGVCHPLKCCRPLRSSHCSRAQGCVVNKKQVCEMWHYVAGLVLSDDLNDPVALCPYSSLHRSRVTTFSLTSWALKKTLPKRLEALSHRHFVISQKTFIQSLLLFFIVPTHALHYTFKTLKSHTKTLKIPLYILRSPLKPFSGGPWPYLVSKEI
jgi:hypothetical protein